MAVNPEQSSEALTRALALWGALLASINTLWMIRRERKDRGSLRVSIKVKLNTFYPSTPGVPDEIWFEVVNDGKRPAYVREPIGITTSRETFVLPVMTNSRVSMPVKLEPEDAISFTTPLARIPLDDMRRLGVVDMIGNRWFASATDFIEVQRRRLEYQKRPIELSLRMRFRARAPLWFRL